MRQDYTHISYLLDRSGSMGNIWDDAKGGYVEFLRTQKAAPGEATFSFSVFDTHYDALYTCAPLAAVPDTFPARVAPRGSTALNDALARLITETGEALAAMPIDQRPSKVVVVVYTDGFENASVKYTKDRVMSLVAQQRDVYGWEFIFLASNMDAQDAAAGYGMGAQNAATVSPQNLRSAINMTAKKVAEYRSTSNPTSLAYTGDERDALSKS